MLELFKLLEVLYFVVYVEHMLDSLLIGVLLANKGAHEIIIQLCHIPFMTLTILAQLYFEKVVVLFDRAKLYTAEGLWRMVDFAGKLFTTHVTKAERLDFLLFLLLYF